MGLTYVNVDIANPNKPARSRRKKLLADSGTLDSVVPKAVLRAVGIKPYGAETFTLADGSKIRREVGTAFLRINGRKASSPVIFGEKGDGALLGVIALELLGFTIDPRTGKLRPSPLFLMLTRRGKQAAIVNHAKYVRSKETLDVLSDRNLMGQIRRSRRFYSRGRKGRSFEDVFGEALCKL